MFCRTLPTPDGISGERMLEGVGGGSAKSAPTMDDEVFVAREAELTQLSEILQRSLQGVIEVVFITGKAGAGKTSLLKSFMDGAKESHPKVLAAYAKCGMGASVGDPFQPFDELVLMLDTQAGKLSRKWRLRSRLRRAADTVGNRTKTAVGLLGIIIGIYSTIVGIVIQIVQSLLEMGMPSNSSSKESIPYRERIDELRRFIHAWPILLCLDDFQHSDKQSCALLADLHQRFAGLSAMIMVAFRPLEVGEDHPLFPVYAELAARLGAREIKLDELQLDESNQRRFVDKYLDTRFRPNKFDESFRHRISERTEGLPLFVVDLMKLCEEKGWVRQENDVWIQALAIGQELPVRPESIIRARWLELSSQDQRRLSVATLDGEVFILRVLALALREDEQQLRQQIDHHLVDRLGWVRRTTPRLVLTTQLSRCEFLHTFYFEFVSRQLRHSDRSEWNKRIGIAKRQIWGDRWPDIAGELSHHFEAAEDWTELLPCLEHKLKYLRLLDAPEGFTEVLLKFGDTLRHVGRAEEALERFREAEEIARENKLAATLDGAINGQVWVLFEDLHDYSAAEPRLREIIEQQIVTRQEDAKQVISRRLFFALSVAQLATAQPEAALASLNQALLPDDPDSNDRLDPVDPDLIDARRWLLQLQDEEPGTSGIAEALQRLHNEIGDIS